MSSEAIGAVAPKPTEATETTIVMDSVHVVNVADTDVGPRLDTTGLHSPPDSNNAAKLDGSDSELSDLEDMVEEQLKAELPNMAEPPVDDIGEILPDHWSGTVPVFRPTMHQFRDFKRFVRPSRLPYIVAASHANCHGNR